MKILEDEFNDNIIYQRKVAKGDWSHWKHRFDLKAILVAYHDAYLRGVFGLSDVVLTKENILDYKDEICNSLHVSEKTLKEISEIVNQ